MKKRYLRKQNLFDPHSGKPYKLSRSKVELFLECPRCFYMDRRLGLRRPGRMTFSLNNAVDTLMKREFDHYRQSGTAHPFMKQEGVDAIPYFHDQIDRWREPLHGGLQYLHPETNLLLVGAPDDLWVNPAGELHVVDYKATHHLSQNSLDAGENPGYERQLEFYSWLLGKMNFTPSRDAYFVVAKSQSNRPALNHQLEFEMDLVRHKADWSWVTAVIPEIKETLISDDAPMSGESCDYCNYIDALEHIQAQPKQVSLL